MRKFRAISPAKIANFSSLAPLALAESLEFVGGRPREKQTLCEKTLLAHFQYLRVHVSVLGPACNPERQNVAIRLQRKDTAVSDQQNCPRQLNEVFHFFTHEIRRALEDIPTQARNFAERSPTYSSTCVILEQPHLTYEFSLA